MNLLKADWFCNQKWGLAAASQKANSVKVGVKESLLYFVCGQLGAGGGQTPVQRPIPPSSNNQGARAFTDGGR